MSDFIPSFARGQNSNLECFRWLLSSYSFNSIFLPKSQPAAVATSIKTFRETFCFFPKVK